MWDLEFKKFQLEDAREDRRKEFDRVKETIDALEQQVNNPKNTDETKKILSDQKEEQEKYVLKIEGDLRDLDFAINGKTDPREHDAVRSITEQMDALQERRRMYRAFLKLC